MSDLNDLSLARFTALLDAFGADLGRWPDGEQSAARALIACAPVARRLHGEAVALDRLLDRAPVVPHVRPGLADRIVAAARETAQLPSQQAAPSSAGRSGVVIPWPAEAPETRGAPRAVPPSPARRPPAPPVIDQRRLMTAGAMLAASLLLGVWLGASGTARPHLSSTAMARVLAADADSLADMVLSGLPTELTDGLDEDAL